MFRFSFFFSLQVDKGDMNKTTNSQHKMFRDFFVFFLCILVFIRFALHPPFFCCISFSLLLWMDVTLFCRQMIIYAQAGEQVRTSSFISLFLISNIYSFSFLFHNTLFYLYIFFFYPNHYNMLVVYSTIYCPNSSFNMPFFSLEFLFFCFRPFNYSTTKVERDSPFSPAEWRKLVLFGVSSVFFF